MDGRRDLPDHRKLSAGSQSGYQCDHDLHPKPDYGFNGPLAFDSAGNLWLAATDAMVRYTRSSRTYKAFALPSVCGGVEADIYSLISASDGSVWMLCLNLNSGGESYVRITSSGTMRTFDITTGVETTLLVAGTDGTVWAGSPSCLLSCPSGVTKITPSGDQTFYSDPTDVATQAIAGNGTGQIIDIANCTTGQGTFTCYQKIGSDGSFTQIGIAPKEYTPAATLYQAGMDANGDVWELIDSTATKAAPRKIFKPK